MTTGTVIHDALAACGAVGKQMVSMDELAAGADNALRQAPAGLTADGASAFIATCLVESAWFRTTEEYGTGQRYAPFIGRTFVQLTWRENYAGFGQWCHDHGLTADADLFVNNPRSLADYAWAWLGPVYYFQAHNLWRYANPGNMWAVSQAVNRGDGAVGTDKTPNSWTERLHAFQACQRAGAALLPSGAPVPAMPAAQGAPGRPTLRLGDTQPADLLTAIQRWANAVFPAYAGPIQVYPRFGPQMSRWLVEFQRRSGIPSGGTPEIGPNTWKAMESNGFRFP